jgi:hypothetical protein
MNSEYVALVAALVTGVFGFLAGRLQAGAQLQSELAKLRHAMSARHATLFHDRADRLAAVAVETLVNSKAADELVDGHPHVGVFLTLAAERAVSLEHAQLTQRLSEGLMAWYERLAGLLPVWWKPGAAKGEHLKASIDEAIAGCLRGICAVSRAVDISVEARLSGRPDKGKTDAIAELAAKADAPPPSAV